MSRWTNALPSDVEIAQIKRQAVIREAGRVFSKRGYHNTSLDDVAKSLNVSKGTLYNYVRDKPEILYECHRRALAVGDVALEQALAAGTTGAEQLRLMLTGYLNMLLDEMGSCAILTEIDAMRPEDRQAVVERRRYFEAEYVKMIERGIADGSLRATNPKLAVYCFMGVINWVPRWYNPAREVDSQSLAQQICDVILGGLYSESSRTIAAEQVTPTP